MKTCEASLDRGTNTVQWDLGTGITTEGNKVREGSSEEHTVRASLQAYVWFSYEESKSVGEGMKRAIGRENMVNSGTEVGRYRTQRAVMGFSEALQPGSPEGQWWEEGQPELRRLICSLSSEFFGNNLHAQYKGGVQNGRNRRSRGRETGCYWGLFLKPNTCFDFWQDFNV